MGQPGVKPGAAVIAVLCSYETVAITSGRVPTITALTRARPPQVRVAVLTGTTVWLWVHMLRRLVDET